MSYFHPSDTALPTTASMETFTMLYNVSGMAREKKISTKINNTISFASTLQPSHQPTYRSSRGSYPKTIINRKRKEGTREIMNWIMRIVDISHARVHIKY